MGRCTTGCRGPLDWKEVEVTGRQTVIPMLDMRVVVINVIMQIHVVARIDAVRDALASV